MFSQIKGAVVAAVIAAEAKVRSLFNAYKYHAACVAAGFVVGLIVK